MKNPAEKLVTLQEKVDDSVPLCVCVSSLLCKTTKSDDFSLPRHLLKLGPGYSSMLPEYLKHWYPEKLKKILND